MTALATGHSLRLIAVLIALGAGWGLTQPLTKIAVSDGAGPMGLVFWQMLIGALLLSGINALRGKSLPWTGRAIAFYLFIAILGTLFPNFFSYQAAFHLPSGVMSIIISTIPMMAFPIALALGADQFSARRLTGLLLGFTGVLLIALPEASLPERAMVAWLPIALIAPLCYAVEENVVGKWGTLGLDGLQVLQGASIVGCVLALPLSLAMGHWVAPAWPMPPAHQALIAASVIHALVYSSFMWLIMAAGAVFAAQVSTFVTAFGVLWAIWILGEAYSGYIWTALALMLAGLALVQPRKGEAH